MMRFVTVFAAAALVACAAEQGATLQILDSPTFSEDCSLSASQQFTRSQGFYDAWAFGGAVDSAYVLSLRIRNQMLLSVSDPAESFDRPIRPNTTNVNLTGFDVCFGLADIVTSASGIPDCDAAPPSQRRFVAASGRVQAGDGIAVLSVPVLSLQDLQAPGVFGSNFNPQLLPALGSVVADANLDGDVLDAADRVYTGIPAESPLDPARTPTLWGTFPADRTQITILVILRANGKTQDGKRVTSNWFLFPVEVCVGCAANACGALVITDCGGASTCAGNVPCEGEAACAGGGRCFVGDRCPDGTPCAMSMTCPGTATACTPPVFAYTGETIDFVESCLPSQVESIKCVERKCP